MTGNCSSNMLSLRRVDSVARPSCNQSFNCGQLFMIHDTSTSQTVILHSNKLLVSLCFSFTLHHRQDHLCLTGLHRLSETPFVLFILKLLFLWWWRLHLSTLFFFFFFSCTSSVVTTQTIASVPGWLQLLQNIRKHSTGTYPCWPTCKQKIMVQHLGWRPLLRSFGPVSSQMV